MEVPVYSLGFGRNADFNLIKGISDDADGFSKHIYEDSDAALQLENFFLEIANPVLSDLKFQYVGDQVDNDSLTDLSYHCLFKGGEFVVSGKLNGNALREDDDGVLQVIVEAAGQGGETYNSSSSFCLTGINPQENIIDNDASLLLPFPCIVIHDRPRSQAQNFLQNLHAFLNIKQLLKRQDEVTENEDEESPKEKALRLSLSNNFVTELTSLVVVQPDEDPKIATIDKGDVQHSSYQPTNAYGYSGIVPLSLPVPKSSGGLSYYVSGGGYSSYNLYAYDASYASYDYDISADYVMSLRSDYDMSEDYSSSGSPQISTTTTPAGPCSGSLTLFSKTYNRGENVTVTEDTPDLDEFNNRLVSALVEGDCCWAVYTGENYSGDSEVFRHGQQYDSVVSVGKTFRKGVSVRKLNRC